MGQEGLGSRFLPCFLPVVGGQTFCRLPLRRIVCALCGQAVKGKHIRRAGQGYRAT